MTLSRFLDFFDFSYEKDEDGYGLIDNQGANLGGIENERFETVADVVERFNGSIYIPDYIDYELEEDGCMETEIEKQYEWCVANKHPYKDILYALIHPETVKESD